MIKNDLKNWINDFVIESGTTSECSSDYDSDTDSITALDEFEDIMNNFLLSIGNTFTESYSENNDLDGDERLYLDNLLFQVLSDNCDLSHCILCYICSRIPLKELIQMEQRCKGSCKRMADAISYVGSCGLLLHRLTKFRKKGSVDYDSKDKVWISNSLGENVFKIMVKSLLKMNEFKNIYLKFRKKYLLFPHFNIAVFSSAGHVCFCRIFERTNWTWIRSIWSYISLKCFLSRYVMHELHLVRDVVKVRCWLMQNGAMDAFLVTFQSSLSQVFDACLSSLSFLFFCTHSPWVTQIWNK